MKSTGTVSDRRSPLAARLAGGIAMLAGGLMLTACQTLTSITEEKDPESEIYIGWYCTGEKRSDTWVCSQRRLRNGEPVDDVVYAVKRSSDSAEQGSALSPTTGETSAQGSWQDWKEKLPTLDDTLVAGAAESGDQNQGAQPRPERPKPVPAFDDWVEPDGDTATTGDDTAANPSFSARVQPGSEATLDGDYTIQLGAFSSEARRDEFIDQKGLGRLPLQSYEIISRNRSWWILTYGTYETRDQAIIAWAAVSKNYPTVEIWVRSTESIRKAMPAKLPTR